LGSARLSFLIFPRCKHRRRSARRTRGAQGSVSQFFRVANTVAVAHGAFGERKAQFFNFSALQTLLP